MPPLDLPKNGVGVRMYRQGHGDCFLLALPPQEAGAGPVYVLIDCGYKPGSPAFLSPVPALTDVIDDLKTATGGKLDLVIVTHEHQDHVNGFWKKSDPYFDGFEIEEAWFAWTEDPTDSLAKTLRKRHHDILVKLTSARNKLALAGGEAASTVQQIDEFLGLELGGEDRGITVEALAAAAKDPAAAVNKQAMKFIKDKARQRKGVKYLSPGGRARTIPGTDGIKVYVLGPPRDEDLLLDEDPADGEGFPMGMASASGFSFGAAAGSDPKACRIPFGVRHTLPMDRAMAGAAPFYIDKYGTTPDGPPQDGEEVPSGAEWRRIDNEWLYSAETMALKMSSGINNTSLVLAIELPKSKKVLLFIGDAQRGNWVSWVKHSWTQDGQKITARDLLARTVLYKVGHHGSHNATLAGTDADEHPNLSWMGTGEHGGEFTAMITAVNKWALQVKPHPWVHPLPSIRKALLKKAQGRVLQMDINPPRQPADVPDDVWAEFDSRLQHNQLYFDLTVNDE